MPTDAQKAKILVAIKDMEKHIIDLAKDLEEEEKFNAAAWREYGSELCTNELVANQNIISEKIKTAQEKLKLLQDFLAGKISLSEVKTLATAGQLCTVIIQKYENRKVEIARRVEDIIFIKSLL